MIDKILYKKIENVIVIEELEKLSLSIDKIAKIIRGLQSFSRNSQSDPMIKMNLVHLLNETLELCKERFRLASIDVRVITPESAYISCRPSQISQIFMNFLNNSFDAVIDLAEKWVEIKIEEEENFWKITITDSGQGIDTEIIQKIFLPFYSTKDVGKGTGLGLSISKSLIEDHGGSIILDVNDPHTCFIIHFPKA